MEDKKNAQCEQSVTKCAYLCWQGNLFSVKGCFESLVRPQVSAAILSKPTGEMLQKRGANGSYVDDDACRADTILLPGFIGMANPERHGMGLHKL